jgi:outer membrane lipoprotein-sorting protein
MRVLRSLVFLGCLVGLAPEAVQAAAPSTAPAKITRAELVSALQAVPGVKARYKEERRLALLAAPLVSEGTIHFAPPGKLARHQTKPSRASVVVDGKRLRFGDDVGKDEIDLAANPVVAVFVDSFLQVLAGDVNALEHSYKVEFTNGEGRAWTLTLRPKGEPMTKIVERIVLRGSDAVVRELEVWEVGGDSTLTTFLDVDVAHTYTAKEIADVFKVP